MSQMRQRKSSDWEPDNSDRLNAFEKAKEKGCYVVQPKGYELLLDIDGPEEYEHFKAMVQLLDDNGFGVDIVRDEPSQSPGCRHVVVSTGLWTEGLGVVADSFVRLALEVSFGSDAKRGMLGLITLLDGREGIPSCLFEPKASRATDL